MPVRGLTGAGAEGRVGDVEDLDLCGGIGGGLGGGDGELFVWREGERDGWMFEEVVGGGLRDVI